MLQCSLTIIIYDALEEVMEHGIVLVLPHAIVGVQVSIRLANAIRAGLLPSCPVSQALSMR